MIGQEAQIMASPSNVEESAAVYDTLQIRSNAKDVEGFPTFAALGAATEIPFYTVRNRSEVGEAYTNKDSKDSMPFAFRCYSLGIQFFAPGPLTVLGDDPSDEDVANASIGYMFGRIAPLHAGLILKVREDDKLVHTCELAPAGTGIFGGLGNASGVANTGSNGWPSVNNRWKFVGGIDIPRGAIVEAKLRFSTYGRAFVGALPGPGIDLLGPFAEGDGTSFPRCATIRVSMFGKREVQQRGQLHY